MSDKDTEDKQPFTPLEVVAAIVAFLWFLLTLGVFGAKTIQNTPVISGNGGDVDPDRADSGTSTDAAGGGAKSNQPPTSNSHQ